MTDTPKQFAVMIQTKARTDRYKWITFCVENTKEQSEQIAARLNGLVVERGGPEQALMQTEIWG